MTDLSFCSLPDELFDSAYQVMTKVADEIRASGRKQRVAKIGEHTYKKWQAENANFVALFQGNIVGLATLRDEFLSDWPDYQSLGQVKMLRGLVTNPDFRGSRIGERFVGWILENLAVNDTVYLDCVAGFLPNYYQKLGFELIAKRENVTDSQGISYNICLMRHP